MSIQLCRRIPLFLALLTLSALTSGQLSAAILTGSGPNLPAPAPNPAWPPGISPLQVAAGLSFTGTWNATAHSDWVGTYNANGLIPGAFATGATQYDFTTLPLGYLPAGTFFIFGDVDGGSGNPERFDLTAFNGSGQINSEWLGSFAGPNPVHAVRGPGTGTGGTVLPNDIPGWSWQGTNPNGYHITGASVGPNNPNVALALVTNQPIHRLRLNKPTTHYGFGLQAPPPIPEPASICLMALGCTALGVARRR